MYITELPFPEIRDLAIQRLAREYPGDDPGQRTVHDFTWERTSEGGKFWAIIFIFGRKSGVLPKSGLRAVLKGIKKSK